MSPEEIDAQKAAHLYAVYTLALTLGSLFNVAVFLKINSEIIFSYHLAISLISLAGLYYFRHTLSILYIANALFGKWISKF